jgi:hypothetical protein
LAGACLSPQNVLDVQIDIRTRLYIHMIVLWCVYIYILNLYIYSLGFAQALQRRGFTQTNVDATSQNSYWKSNKGTREY